MDESRRLRGTELRYVLTMHLFDQGPATVNDLIDAVTARGFNFRGRASKSVSDALRWEMGHDRVRRLGRGRYGPGWMPRSTEHRIHRRVLALREDAKRLSLQGGHDESSQLSVTPGAYGARGHPSRGLASVNLSTSVTAPKGPCTA